MNEILQLDSITKNYAGVRALSGVDLSFSSGRIHSIVGENGAGKSTLMQIITGAVTPTGGRIRFAGEEIPHMTPVLSKELGISAVYQELSLIPELSVYQNIFYGRELKKGFFLDEAGMRRRAGEILDMLDSPISVDEPIRGLGIGNCQIVEIAKALVNHPRVILLDEPTASLPSHEAQLLHRIIRNLASQGIAIIFVSHKLDEVLELSDTITVLRDGKKVDSRSKDGSRQNIYDISTLVHQMLGKSLLPESLPDTGRSEEEIPVMRAEGLSNSEVNDISFSLYRGEILSLSGLLGSKRTEVLDMIFSPSGERIGSLYLKGKKVEFRTVLDAIRHKIGYITEDRKDSGLFMELSIRENMSMVALRRFRRGFSLDRRAEEEAIVSLLDRLQVKYASLDQKVKELSGGNQQKIAIGKWLMADPDIILLDEPTRGVDVGAKEEIYKIILELSRSGKSILMVSSEMDEILRLSHRTLVMRNGRFVSEYSRFEISAERILQDSSKFTREVHTQ